MTGKFTRSIWFVASLVAMSGGLLASDAASAKADPLPAKSIDGTWLGSLKTTGIEVALGI